VLYWQYWASFWNSWADIVSKRDGGTTDSKSPSPARHPEIINGHFHAELENKVAERVRSEFLANVNHDLRTPLNAVIGFAEIIESEMFGKIENPQYLEYIKHIQESGYELLSKIEDLCGAKLKDDETGFTDEALEESIRPRNRKKQLVAVD
jgi:signal transduction histidine kinase